MTNTFFFSKLVLVTNTSISLERKEKEMDTKFSVALHILIFVSETTDVASSERLATSVNTNSSYIRKIVALLKKGDIITSHQGKAGFYLKKDKKRLTLEDIYIALYPEKKLFHIHQNPNKDCPIGSRIEYILAPLFRDTEKHLLTQLRQLTLSDVIDNLYSI